MTAGAGVGWRELRAVLLDLDETLIPDECAVDAAIEAAWADVIPTRPSALPSSSTARRTRSQMAGSSCHSSMNTGAGTWVMRSGYASSAARSLGLSSARTVVAR